ncbi:MAG: hypothetical protein P4M13_05385 [Alphaproteobacteria bacterium]|nr:hypothetical protein [Alphaproteobacteria bacterium]
MEIIKEDQKRTLNPTSSLTVYEYDMNDPAIGGGIALLRGRYPDNGFVVNEKTKELVYVLSGEGKLLTPDKGIIISVGDMILLDSGEIYAWEGNMSLHMANAPKFDPQQHKLTAPPQS